MSVVFDIIIIQYGNMKHFFSNTAQRVISLNGVIIDKNWNYVKTWMYINYIQYDFICMAQLSMGS